MKKIFIISIIFTSMILLGNAQKLTQMTPPIDELSRTSLRVFEDSKDEISLLLTPAVRGRWGQDKAGNNTYIMHIERNANKIQSIIPNHIPDDYSVLLVCNNESEFIVYLSDYEKKEKQYTIYKNTYSKTGKSTFKPEKVASFELLGKDNNYVFTSKSEDKSKCSIVFVVCDNKKVLKTIHAITMDNKGNILWQKSENVQLPSASFNIQGCKVNNDGTIYSAIISYDINPRGNIVNNEYVNILTFSENETKIASEAVKGFVIRESAMKMLKNGNIVVSGYSSAQPKSDVNNVFQIQFNPQDESFSSFAKHPLNKIDNLLNTKALGGQIKLEKLNFTVLDIVELENGEPVILGELRAVVARRDSKGFTYYVHHAANILYHNLSETNTTNVVLRKYQTSTSGGSMSNVTNWSRLLISYSYLVKGNDVYFIYNDHAKNFDKPRTDGCVYSYVLGKSACATLAKIDEDGKISKHLINRAKVNSCQFYTNIHSFEDETLLLFNKRKNAFALKTDNMIFKLTDF